MSLTYGSLFSGIGGIDLGLDRAGFTPLWQSEIDPYASRVLAKHWPHVPNLGAITTIDWSTVERPDLICGGYPCQPFSLNGHRRGGDDPRHLWPLMFDAIRALRPRFVLLENVAAHLRLGFDGVLTDLASIGFDAEWSVVSACSVGAPHLRRRLFCLAYPAGWRWDERPDVDSEGTAGPGFPVSVPVGAGGCAPDDRGWAAEPDVVRVADGVPHRVDRLRALGNAVVPQVAELIGRRIMAQAIEAAS